MVAGMTVPHQTAADGVQYAVSTKATTKDDHVSNNDASKQQENQEVQYIYIYIYIYTYYQGFIMVRTVLDCFIGCER